MAREESELRTPSSSRLLPEDDVMQLVEHWIQGFEHDSDEKLDGLPGAPPPEALETAPSDRNAETEIPPTATILKADQLPLKSTGLLTTFTDHIGGSISLSQASSRLQHRGTVAVRSRCTSLDAAGKEIGLPDHVIRAFEFVASWFGCPFDAVNLRGTEREALSWGFWGLGGRELAGCLQQWKRQSPQTFASYLTAFGIDVVDGPLLRVQIDGSTVDGRGAEWAIASEPRFLAVLARAGRDQSAQKAQLDTVVANWVRPVLFQTWNPFAGHDALTVDTLTSASHIAVLLYLIRRHGRRTAVRLVHTVHTRYRPENDQDAWLTGLVRLLKRLGREDDSTDVLRISSSPELTAA